VKCSKCPEQATTYVPTSAERKRPLILCSLCFNADPFLFGCAIIIGSAVSEERCHSILEALLNAHLDLILTDDPTTERN